MTETTVLSPSWAEMTHRHVSKARSLLRLAERYGDTPKGRQYLADAEVATRLAEAAALESRRTLLLRNGFIEAAGKLDAEEAARV